MAYEPRTHDGSLWGFYNELIAPTAEKLRAYFEAKIPVIVSGDGLTYRAERLLPGDDVPPDEAGSTGD